MSFTYDLKIISHTDMKYLEKQESPTEIVLEDIVFENLVKKGDDIQVKLPKSYGHHVARTHTDAKKFTRFEGLTNDDLYLGEVTNITHFPSINNNKPNTVISAFRQRPMQDNRFFKFIKNYQKKKAKSEK